MLLSHVSKLLLYTLNNNNHSRHFKDISNSSQNGNHRLMISAFHLWVLEFLHRSWAQPFMCIYSVSVLPALFPLYKLDGGVANVLHVSVSFPLMIFCLNSTEDLIRTLKERRRKQKTLVSSLTSLMFYQCNYGLTCFLSLLLFYQHYALSGQRKNKICHQNKKVVGPPLALILISSFSVTWFISIHCCMARISWKEPTRRWFWSKIPGEGLDFLLFQRSPEWCPQVPGWAPLCDWKLLGGKLESGKGFCVKTP